MGIPLPEVPIILERFDDPKVERELGLIIEYLKKLRQANGGIGFDGSAGGSVTTGTTGLTHPQVMARMNGMF